MTVIRPYISFNSELYRLQGSQYFNFRDKKYEKFVTEREHSKALAKIIIGCNK
jgi:hypothetical protein